MTVVMDYAAMAVILFLAVKQDIKENKISNRLNVSGTVAGLLLALLLPHRSVADALAGVVVCFLCGFAGWILKAFRAGDAKLLCVMGAFFGWKLGLSCVIYAVLAGSVIGLPGIILHRVFRRERERTVIPFAAAVAAAAVLCVVFGAVWDCLPMVWQP